MKDDFEQKKQIYSAWSVNFGMPFAIIAVFVFSMLVHNGVDTLILAAAIFGQVATTKAGFKGRALVAPILCYCVVAVDVLGTLIFAVGGNMQIGLAVIGLAAILLYLLAVIFYFLTANDIKKQYPRLKQDYKDAVAARKNSLK